MQQNVTSTKEEYFEYRKKSTKTRTGVTRESQSFTPKMFENRGTYCQIYGIYIPELSKHKLCSFVIQGNRRCQSLANKDFFSRRT